MLHRAAVDQKALELLERLMRFPPLDGFYLAGGTALALQLGHRISIDLDLFDPGPFDHRALSQSLKGSFTFDIIGEAENTLNCIFNGCKVDMIGYRYPLVGNLISEDSFRLASLADIGCMKLSAIASRGMKRDFFDLFFLLRHFSLGQLLGYFGRKYDSAEKFHVIKSLSYFDDAESDPQPRMLIPVTWDEVKSVLVAEVRKL
jgi:hypothetical protein